MSEEKQDAIQGEIVTDIKPYAPVGNAATLEAMVQARMDRLTAVLPSGVTPDRLLKTLLVAVNRSPEILECTQVSVLETVLRAAELGLDLSGTLGEAYPIPFNEKRKIKRKSPEGGVAEIEVTEKQLKLVIGYRGLQKLARNTGEVRRIEAGVVREKDEFVFEQGMEPKLIHRPAIREADRGPILGAWALIELAGGAFQFEYMSRAEIELVRSRARSANSPAWKNWWEEMGKKTVARRLMKWVSLSGEKLQRALEIDNEDYDLDREVAQVALPVYTPAAQPVPLAGVRLVPPPVPPPVEPENLPDADPLGEALGPFDADPDPEPHPEEIVAPEPAEAPEPVYLPYAEREALLAKLVKMGSTPEEVSFVASSQQIVWDRMTAKEAQSIEWAVQARIAERNRPVTKGRR